MRAYEAIGGKRLHIILILLYVYINRKADKRKWQALQGRLEEG